MQSDQYTSRDNTTARMAQNFERVNAQHQPRYWDDKPLSYRIVMIICAVVAAGVVGTFIGSFLLHLFVITAANLIDPLAGSPF